MERPRTEELRENIARRTEFTTPPNLKVGDLWFVELHGLVEYVRVQAIYEKVVTLLINPNSAMGRPQYFRRGDFRWIEQVSE